MYQRKTEETLEVILEYALFLGIRQQDHSFARDLSKDCEYRACLEAIVVQMYEYDVAVDKGFLTLIAVASWQLQIEPDEHSHLGELLDEKIEVPAALQNRARDVIKNSVA